MQRSNTGPQYALTGLWFSESGAGAAHDGAPAVFARRRRPDRSAQHRAAYEAWLHAELSHFDILAVTEQTSVAYAALRAALERSGRPIPANDAWIAALALQHGLPVLSRDAHFDVVPQLARTSW